MKRWALVCIIGLVALCLGCGKQEEPKKTVTPGEVKQKAGEAAKTAKEFMAQQQEKYLKQAQEKLQGLDQKISDLKKRAETQTGDLKKKLEDQAQTLQKQADAAKDKLAGLKSVSDEAWNKFKAGVDDALAELEKGFKETETQKK